MSDKKADKKTRKLAEKHGVSIEPDPIPNDGPSAHDLVCADMQARKAFGLAKYNSLLQPFNGRDSLKDAYDEVLDLAVYLRTLIEERDTNKLSPEIFNSIPFNSKAGY